MRVSLLLDSQNSVDSGLREAFNRARSFMRYTLPKLRYSNTFKLSKVLGWIVSIMHLCRIRYFRVDSIPGNMLIPKPRVLNRFPARFSLSRLLLVA